MTPLHLQFCIAFAGSKEPMHMLGNSYDSPAGKNVKAWMIAEGLILDGEKDWGTPTTRLYVFVEHLCQQPLPVSKWVMPEDKP